jgi:membrane dipeptidase
MDAFRRTPVSQDSTAVQSQVVEGYPGQVRSVAVSEKGARALRLHQETDVVDCHADWILLIAKEVARGRPNPLGDRWVPHLRAGGVDVQVMPVFVEAEYLPEGALRRTLVLLELLHRQAALNPGEVVLATNGSEIDRGLRESKILLVAALEGSPAIGNDITLIETFFRLGVRMASFSWFGRTFLAEGSGEEDAGGRLTKAGVAAMAEMERLGMLMDVSHLSARSTDHVLEIATRPVVASHSSARAICDHHRNLSDEHLKGIATLGGVTGINFFHAFVDPENPTIDRLVDHIEHVASVAGVDHVGIGPDFVKEYFEEFYPNDPDLMIEGLRARVSIDGLETSSDLPALTAKMLDRGFSPGDVKKVLGENFLRVFREVMGVPIPQ